MMKKVLCHCPQVPHIHLLVLQNSTFFDKTELIEKEIKNNKIILFYLTLKV